MALSDNLISYWKMDEASGNAIDAHGSNDLTDANTVGSAAGKINGARDFVRANSEAFYITDNADMSVSGDFTFSFWFQVTDGNTSSLISKLTSGWFAEYNIRVVSQDVWFQVNGGTNVVSNDPTFLNPNTWYHCVCYHDDGTEIGVIINDGTPSTYAHTGGTTDGNGTFSIGSQYVGAPYSTIDGMIDEVGFWKRKLTAAEITELYNSGSGRNYEYINPPVVTGAKNFLFPF